MGTQPRPAVLRVLSFISVVSIAMAENSYMFISPKTIRPGHQLTVQGSLLTSPTSPVDVTVSIVVGKPRWSDRGGFPEIMIMPPRPILMLREINATFVDANDTTEAPTTTTTTTTPAPTPAPEPLPVAEAYATFTDTQTQNIVLNIPATLIDGDFDLKISGSGGLTFENTTRLNYEKKSRSIFVQTDKAIYKPGQTVHFRVFGMTPDLKIIVDKMDVDLFDPSGNKINQWDVAEKDLLEAAGVFESQMLMSDSPILGNWKLKVVLGNEKYEKIFEVDEYVLPKFEASLDLPPFGRANDKMFQFKVDAKYTYGKPVKGEAMVRIKAKWPRFDWVNNTRVPASKEIELKKPIDGTVTFEVTVEQLRTVDKYLDHSSLVFEANVTETLTGSKMSASEELEFFENPIKLEFPSALPSNFKPGMPYMAVLKVAERDDSPPSQIKGPVTVNVTFFKPMVTTTTTSTTTTTTPSTPPEPIMIDGKMVFPVVEPRIKPTIIEMMPPRRWWWPRDEEVKQPSQTFTIPADGIVEIPITVPTDITRVEMNAEYEKTTAYHTIRKAYSPSNSYIQLRLLTPSPKTGGTVEIEVKSTETTGLPIYQVMSKGNIVASSKFNLADGVIRLPVTSDMAPKAKVMVYNIRADGEVVADGLSFNVDGIFDNKVTMEFDRPQAQPGDNIMLNIKADPGSKVNVLAIDKSVLLLKTGNDITKDQVQSELESYDPADRDNFCGWFCWRMPRATGGQDAESVFRNTGIVYITDALVYQHEEPFRGRPMPRMMMRAGGGAPMMAFRSMAVESAPMAMAAPPPAVAQLKKPERVRKLFPETWLWSTQMTSGGPMPMMMMMDDGPQPGMAFGANAAVGGAVAPAVSQLKKPERVRKLFPETWLWSTEKASGGPMSMFKRMDGGPQIAFAAMAAAPIEMAMAAPPPAVSQLKKPERVRKLFPETWLWSTQQASATGDVAFNETVPDTITSWVATAFAIHPESGLGLSETSANLKTFLPFFVSLHMPYSVVRGEKVIVQANVFNYGSTPIFAYVMLKRSEDFENIHINPWWTSTYSANVARFVRIQPDSAVAVYFPIIPKTIGKINLEVEARTLASADAIKKELIVEPEGTPKEYNVPVLIDMQEPTFTKTIPITFPVGTVAGSQRVRVSVIGDLMGPSINGLDELLKMPYGCGEQNMLNFAPNIFITKYLQATNNLDPATFEKSKGFMVKGYQRELTYQHDDGSFSAFGNSDPSGSMWLSAFVLKSFSQAQPFIFIDNNVLTRTVRWIIKHQNVSGNFNEPGKVLHKEMQGGSIASERALTSFVLIALLEARNSKQLDVAMDESVSKAIAFIENGIADMSDVYELAIASYALTLAASPRAKEVAAKLDSLAKPVTGGMKHWEVPEKVTKVEVNPWESRGNTGKAVNIELTAYALLALAQANNRVEGLQVLKWLISQRNPNGGYSSTQDTVVALQSLADMASLVYSKDFNINITVTGPVDSNLQEQFVVNPDNALVLQSRDLPSDIKEVNIAAIGSGLGLAEVAVFYNIDSDDQAPSFNLKVSVVEESMNDFKVETCTSWLKEEASSMAVIEIGTPSGFSADKASVTPRSPVLKRVEDGDKKVVLYLDEIGKEELCFNVSMERVGLVAGAQPVPVKVYDYYEPTNDVIQFYVPDAIRTSDVCDVCGKECSFCQQQQPWWRGA